MRKEANQVLKQFVGVLEANPSPKNAGAVPEGMEIPILLGADADSGACSMAWKALGKAGETIHGRSEQDFRRSPTADNFGKMLEAKVFIQQIGGDSESRPAGWKAAGGVAYVVKTGESLGGISKQFYGSPG